MPSQTPPTPSQHMSQTLNYHHMSFIITCHMSPMGHCHVSLCGWSIIYRNNMPHVSNGSLSCVIMWLVNYLSTYESATQLSPHVFHNNMPHVSNGSLPHAIMWLVNYLLHVSNGLLPCVIMWLVNYLLHVSNKKSAMWHH